MEISFVRDTFRWIQTDTHSTFTKSWIIQYWTVHWILKYIIAHKFIIISAIVNHSRLLEAKISISLVLILSN